MKRSSGVLLFRRREGQLEVFLVHPGGPFWARKDLGAWSIPKGEFEEGEDPLATARREFAEETGSAVEGEFLPLGEVKQPGGKWVSAFALEYDFDTALMKSNTFTLEWPPKSGNSKEFPEVDKCGWFSLPVAREKLLKGQIDFLMRLENSLDLRVKAKA
jgi:predicted NUDIX family NTP pyrophosphohydrolase